MVERERERERESGSVVRSTTCPEGSEKRLEGTVEDGGTSITTKSKVKSSINGRARGEGLGIRVSRREASHGWVGGCLALPSLGWVHLPILVSNLASGDLDLRHGKHASKRSDKQHKSPTITGATDNGRSSCCPPPAKLGVPVWEIVRQHTFALFEWIESSYSGKNVLQLLLFVLSSNQSSASVNSAWIANCVLQLLCFDSSSLSQSAACFCQRNFSESELAPRPRKANYGLFFSRSSSIHVVGV